MNKVAVPISCLKSLSILLMYLRSYPGSASIVRAISRCEKYIENCANQSPMERLDLGEFTDHSEVMAYISSKCMDRVEKLCLLGRDVHYLTDVLKVLVNAKDNSLFVLDYSDAIHGLPDAIAGGNLDRQKYISTYIEPFISRHAAELSDYDMSAIRKWS